MTDTLSFAQVADIETRLARRGARFDGCQLDLDRAKARSAVTAAIATAFPLFERVREVVIGRKSGELVDLPARRLVDRLLAAGVVAEDDDGVYSPSADADRYLRGGWLEEHIGLSALAAGADEVRIGQKIRWIAGDFQGENEIDTIARFGDRLVFVSAKALHSRLDKGDVRHRDRLMAALQEADNLIDHFGEIGSAVALVVSTDLWNESTHRPRYEQLFGKATALKVDLITLEDLDHDALVRRLVALARGGAND